MYIYMYIYIYTCVFFHVIYIYICMYKSDGNTRPFHEGLRQCEDQYQSMVPNLSSHTRNSQGGDYSCGE